jgi:hypothetical protein
VGGDSDAYCYGRKLLARVGWEIYLGDDDHGHERWEPIARVRISGDQVRITAADGVTYVAGYVDAVRCRRPALAQSEAGLGALHLLAAELARDVLEHRADRLTATGGDGRGP